MELRDYLRAARRRWLLIVGTLLVAMALAAVITSQTTKQYASTARVFVSTTPSDSSDAYQGTLFAQQRVNSYADLLSGHGLLQKVIDKSKLDMTASELAKNVDAVVVPQTVNIKITVTDRRATQAQLINQGVVAQLKDLVRELETQGRRTPLLKASVVDSPSLPETPIVSPQPARNAGLALVLGLVLGFGLAVLRELLDASVKRGDDVPPTR